MDYAALGEAAQKAIEDELNKRGDATVLIAGKTGVGKSTLVNCVFQGRIAETGQGRPVSPGVKEYSKDGIPVRIVDTRGVEIDAYATTVTELLSYLKQRNSGPDPKLHVHVAWYCIAEDSRRVEEQESAIVAEMAQLVPVIGVITKARSDNGFRSVVLDQLADATNVVRVRALSEELDDGHELPAWNLDALVELTMEVIPEGQRKAFAAAQRASLKQKQNQAHKEVAVAATAAAAAGATPIPFSDAFVLAPIQIGMLAKISLTFNLNVTQAFLSTIVSGAIAGVGGSFAGRALVSGLLKLIPGGGTIVGGTIAATTAALMTTLFGEAYIAALSGLLRGNMDRQLTPEEVAKAFRQELSIRSARSE